MGHAADGICSYSNPVLRSGPDSGPPNNEQLYTKLGVHFATNLNSVSTTIPKSIPAREYLLRVEHIGLHVAGKPQFYPACAQLRVTGEGSGSPSPKVSFPGAYKTPSPSFTADIWKGSKPYPMPGPPAWKG